MLCRCFQTMLTAISMSAIATNGVVPGERVGGAGARTGGRAVRWFSLCRLQPEVLITWSLAPWGQSLVALSGSASTWAPPLRVPCTSSAVLRSCWYVSASCTQGQNSTCEIFTSVASPTHLLLHPIAPHPPSFSIASIPSDIYRSSGGHFQDRGAGGSGGWGRSPQQHAGVRHHCPELHGAGGVCGGQICEQAGTGLPSMRHPLHSGCLCRRHQNRCRPSCFPVSDLWPALWCVVW